MHSETIPPSSDRLKSDRSWQKGIFGVIDLGSQHTVCLIGRGLVDGRIEIRGHSRVKTEGVESGCITDIKKAAKTLSKVLSAAEREAKTSLSQVCINISCGRPMSRRITVKGVPRTGKVTIQDVTALYKRAFEFIDSADRNRRGVQCFPISFGTQSLHGLQDPVGHTASSLSGNFLTLTVDREQLANLEKIVLAAGVEAADMIPAGISSALSVMRPEDSIVGTTVINIGGGTTSWATFYAGSIQDFGQIPMGSHHITMDLVRNFGIDFETAEKLKVTDGTVDYEKSADEKHTIELPPGSRRRNNVITIKDLSRFIKPCMERILRNIKAEILKSSFLGAKDCNIILTGGGAQLDGLEDFATRILNKEAILGKINVCKIPEDFAPFAPHFSSSIGLLAWQLGMNKDYGMAKISKKHKSSLLKRMLPFKH